MNKCKHCGASEELKLGETYCEICKKSFEKYDKLIHIDNEMKNEHLFLDNHVSTLKVYCPFCGKDLSNINNIFTDEGYGESMNSGVECKDCGVDIYTYKVEKSY